MFQAGGTAGVISVSVQTKNAGHQLVPGSKFPPSNFLVLRLQCLRYWMIQRAKTWEN